ncbi:MAG: ribosome maturation factor RimP [Actinomycetaceae bacterium]|nr:ribosome maturation factor RimP [Actinomycetaceae bacterium]
MGKSSKKKQQSRSAAKNNQTRQQSTRLSVPDETTERISNALNDIVVQAGLYLESVSARRAGGTRIIHVVLDLPWGPGGLDSDKLTEVSREISAKLDDVDLVEGAYTLEVSTPGTDRKLTESRHFSRAIGRLVRFQLSDDSRITGRIESVYDDKVNINTDNGERCLSLAEIVKAQVKVELSQAQD